MKRLLCLFIALNFIFATGCQTALARDKEKMIGIWSHDEKYITLTGQVMMVDDDGFYTMVVIQCDTLPQYIENKNHEWDYRIFSEFKVDVAIGDTITYTTVENPIPSNKWLPIVAISKNGESLLTFDEGKKNLINWVNQLEMK